jgi:hypothetical protein
MTQDSKDIVAVLNWFVARERQRGTHFPDHIGDALKRLTDDLLTEAQRSAKRVEELKAERSRLISRRGQLTVLMTDQHDLLTRNAKGQASALLRRTKEEAPRTKAAHADCVQRLGEVEAEIERLSKPETKAAIAA